MPAAIPPQPLDPTEEALLEAGLALIREKGMRKMTVEEAVRRAGVSKRTLCRLFPTKEEFALACITHGKAAMWRAIDGPAPEQGRLGRSEVAGLLGRLSFDGGESVVGKISPEGMCAGSDQMMEMLIAQGEDTGMTIEEGEVNGAKGWWYRLPDDTSNKRADKVMFYVHGGGFESGSANSRRLMAMALPAWRALTASRPSTRSGRRASIPWHSTRSSTRSMALPSSTAPRTSTWAVSRAAQC